MARPRLALALALLTLLPLLPVATANAPTPLGAEGPDVDGAYLLTYEIVRATAGSAQLALLIERDDGESVLLATRELGQVELPLGVSTRSFSFLPAEGAGDYAVALSVNDRVGEPLRFTVADADGGSAMFAYAIPDEPTNLALTSDSVNGDLKLKSPGDAVVTRATFTDANGWGDVDGVRFRVERQQGDAWLPFDTGAVVVDALREATSVPIEHRYGRSPIAAATYRLTLSAHRADIDLANASRTFVIREVAPTFLAGALPSPAIPDENLTLLAAVVIGDRNGVAPDALLDARVFRGSARVEGSGFAVSLAGAGNTTLLSAGAPLPDADGAARVSIPLALNVPARATAGAHRVSLYVDGALVGTMPFDVAPLPTLTQAKGVADGDAWLLHVNGTGDGVLVATLRDAEGVTATTRAALTNGTGAVRVEAPSSAPALSWTLALHARDGGPALEQRSGTWNRTQHMPTLVLVPERTGPRLPATWRLESNGWDLAGASAEFTFLRWDGAPEPALSGRLDGDRVRVDGPATLTPGRYEARATLQLPNGTLGEISWHFEAGPWVRLEVGAAVVSGREARISVENGGGVALHRLVVEVAGSPAAANATLSWESANATARQLTKQGGRFSLGALDLAPGGSGTLVVRLPNGPLPSGELHTKVRIVALPGGG